MNINKIITFLMVAGFLMASCEKDEITPNTISEKEGPAKELGDIEVEQFVYRGMNDIYLYKEDVPELSDDYFSDTDEKDLYLAGFDSPEDLFDDLTSYQDRFSFITDDYIALEESFKGISSSVAGMGFGIGRISNTDNIFGYLQYIVPGTAAEEAGLTRGTIFTEVDGIELTLNNFSSLLDANTFTINIGYVQNGEIQLTGETATLSHNEYTENPVFISKVLDVEGQKVGYLMYNSFIGDFDDELNAAFGEFRAAGISDLVLDLRYNGGGSVESAVDLSSMITGQFEGQVFMKEQWNTKYQTYYESKNPESLLNRFDPEIRTNEAINSLNLSSVYIITTGSTASASELVINGLDPYIDVIQVGKTTTGKFQASVTLYDSDDFGKEGANENHTYAIQPLIFKSANSVGKSDYVDGLAPDVVIGEDLNEMGVLGDPTEPMLEAALNDYLGRPQEIKSATAKRAADNFRTIGQGGMFQPGYQEMYVEEIPPILDQE